MGTGACSSTGGSTVGVGGSGDPYEMDSASGDGDRETVGDSGLPGDEGDDAATTGDAGETDAGDSSGDPGDPPEPGTFAPCPDPLPDGWIFCEDFEELVDPGAVFFDFSDANGAFMVADRGGASGFKSMEATFEPETEAAGFLSVSFGENPISPSGERPDYAPDGHFDEIYWRFRVKMQAGWPDVGPHGLTRATAFAGENWQQAMIAELTSNGDGVTLLGTASTCVVDDEVACQGYDDEASLFPLSVLEGKTPLFSEALSGTWHCVEVHVALNSPGVADGTLEYWVDDEYEAGSDVIDWRGAWTEYGLNLITIENFWEGGPPVELTRSIDDLAIATVPIGCA